MSTKLAPADRKQQILDEALKQSETLGYQNITRERLAAGVGVSPALVSMYFLLMVELKAAVVAEAVRVENLTVIAQALAARDPAAQRVPAALKRKALAALTA